MKCCHKQDDSKQSEAPEAHLGVPIVLRSRVVQLGDLVSRETLQTNTERPQSDRNRTVYRIVNRLRKQTNQRYRQRDRQTADRQTSYALDPVISASLWAPPAAACRS